MEREQTRGQNIASEKKDTPRPCISIEEQGPFHVMGPVKLRRRIRILNADGEAIAWQWGEEIHAESENFDLCRCGHSKNKPFCDKSHLQVQWDGRLTADRGTTESRQKVFRGKGMILTDDETLCAGFAFCDPFGSVWAEIKQTADPEVRERLKEQIQRCPSGRLRYLLEMGTAPVEINYEPTIAVISDGPLQALGGISVQAPDGFVYEVRNRQLLCRCGLSKNKPFCDGSHWDSGFRAP